MFPDFNRLKVFYYIFSLKSIAAAAAELNITQSAVSQNLQKLEAEIHTPLFVRLHKRLVPTTAGERLFSVICPFIEALKSELNIIEVSREKPAGRLKIGSPVEFGKKYFPPMFAAFRKKHPDVTFFLELGHSPALLSMISRGELDFAFVDIFHIHKRFGGDLNIFSIKPMFEEEVILACSKGYYQSRVRKNHSFEHLLKQDYIAYHPRTLPLKNWFRHHFNKDAGRLSIVMIVESLQAVVGAIKNHMGLGIVASHVIEEEMQRGEILSVSTPSRQVMNQISLVQLQDKIPTLTEKVFLAFFETSMASAGMMQHFQPVLGETEDKV